MPRTLAVALGLIAAACGSRARSSVDPLEGVAEQLAPAGPALGWGEVSVAPRVASAVAIDGAAGSVVPIDGAAGSVVPIDGRAVFIRECQGCHGVNGDGHGALAPNLRVPPADLTAGVFKLKSTPADALPVASDLFRTLTAGIPPSGMPSFAHLDAATRWALVAYVRSLSPRWREEPEGAPLDLTAETAQSSRDGASLYAEAGCADCHGKQGRGDGPAAHDLTVAPTDFGAGAAAFKGGATAADVFRTLLTGFPGSPMPSYAEAGLSRPELWALAAHVAALAKDGRAQRVKEWRTFLGALGLEPPRFTQRETEPPPKSPGADGCLRCHAGVETINDKMQPSLLAVAGGRSGGTCVVCHEGNVDASTEREAHAGLIANPGSLWAVGLGMGCAKCHTAGGSLTTFQGRALPVAVGGKLMNVVSRVSDPTGATGSGHAYRVPRGLMAAELGKATTTMLANGLAHPGEAFADVPVDDPDGPVPLVGSPAYKAWVAQAIEHSFLHQLNGAQTVPGYADGLKRFGSAGDAAIGEFFRKDCARCHLWDRGFPGAGGRHRSEGCSACHVVYPLEDEHPDAPGVRKESHGESARANQPVAHRITAQIPSFQCAHCHWRGGGYYSDLHYERGMDCVDCHSSIDVHGDGNLYPTMHLQVEVACEDCHGTTTRYPWELPVGYGTPVPLSGPRGVAQADGRDFLLTSRGNARQGWQRQGNQAVVVGIDGRTHPIPLLRNLHEAKAWKSEAGRVAMDALPAHLEKVECIACHVPKVVQCQGCHVKVDMQGSGIDWVSSARVRRSPWERADHAEGLGHSEFSPSPKVLVEPPLGRDLQGKVTALVPGCILNVDVTAPSGTKSHVAGQGLTKEGLPRATLAPLIPHATSTAARSCESCHSNPVALGYGVAADRGAPADVPRARERGPLGRPSAVHWTETEEAHGMEAGGANSNFAALDVNRLVSRGGVQLKSLADPGEGPLTREERDHTERQGTCLACHRLASTPVWDRVKARIGAATTPEAHDRAMEALLREFARTGK